MAVVKSLVSSSELHWLPYEIPSSGGCLWADSNWSCSNDTTLDDYGHAAVIGREAGFLEIEGEGYIAEGVSRTSPTHRIWYAFQPAQTAPKDRALAVFFNGGPGHATSSLMFAFNTATYTLDPSVNGNGVATPNSNAWTKFANLLYIDAPVTGFSYPLKASDGSEPLIGIDIDRDAGIFLQVLLGFLARHPDLQSNPVILVGESYGGVRATLMLKYLYGSSTEGPSNVQPGSGNAYQDQDLYDTIGKYFASVFGTKTTPTTADIASKFGTQVLVEPGIAGYHQTEIATAYTNTVNANCLSQTQACVEEFGQLCPTYCWQQGSKPGPRNDAGAATGVPIYPTCDPYDCDKSNTNWPAQWSWSEDQQEAAAVTTLNTVGNLSMALGVDATTIAWMQAGSRQNAYGRGGGLSLDSMKGAFGTLTSTEDSYFVVQNDEVLCGYYGCGVLPPFTVRNHARQWDDMIPTYPTDCGLATGLDFLKNVDNGVSTLITVVKFDTSIWSPSIPYGLSDGSFSTLTSGVPYDPTYATGLSLPGAAGVCPVVGCSPQEPLFMPGSYDSGHTVVMRDPASLLGDVMLWYGQDVPHTGPPYKH
jgi:hypothetical protein